MPRVVVQRHRARMTRAERVEQIRHRDALGDRRGVPARHLGQVPRLEQPAGDQRVERQIVRHQRMHPVDRDEFFGERVRRGVMVVVRADDAAERVAIR